MNSLDTGTQMLFSWHRQFRILIPLLVLSLAGCSSTGYSTKSNIEAPKTIRSPSNVHPEIAKHAPRFVESLLEAGFLVGDTEDPRALELIFEFNGNPFNLRVAAGLWRDGVPVLTASATNSGWGTAMARGSAVNSLADSALEEFQDELDSLMATTRIVPDKTQPKSSDADRSALADQDTAAISADQKYDLLERLKELLDDGVLTEEEYEAEKARILGH